MTVINRVYDQGLGRWRDPYPSELPPSLRGDRYAIERGKRRAARDAAERSRRQGRQR